MSITVTVTDDNDNDEDDNDDDDDEVNCDDELFCFSIPLAYKILRRVK